jgi:outer membrane protein
VEAEITAAWEAARTAEAAIRSIRAQVDAAAFALDGVRQEALVGARTVLDVLDAEQELFAAEVELARAERERVLADYRQRAAVGRLTARDLSLAVAYHVPDEHYRDARGRWFGLGPRLGAE